MAANSTDISVCARFSDLPGLVQALARGARQLDISEADSLRLQLIVEELFTNTLSHGFRGDSETVVSCQLTREHADIRLCYSDAAPPYDPTCAPEQVASEDSTGGLGITLIRGMTRSFHYRRRDDRNICEILL